MTQGTWDPKFDAVRQSFETNVRERNEVGAAVCVYVDGQPVVDIWDGWLDEEKTRPWTRESIVNVWSVGKAFTAVALLRLVDAGKVDLDAPVATYWPEFAQGGKENIPVHMLMSHRAGMSGIRKWLPAGANLTNWDLVCSALAEQEPWWEPGTMFGYHTNTLGFLLGEIVRRVDGRSIGNFIREEISQPLDADFLVGFGPEHDHRVADWINYKAEPGEENLRPWLEVDPEKVTGLDLARYMTYRNPPPLPDAGTNSRIWRAAEYPSTSPHANARGIARIYAALSRGGESGGGYRLLAPETIDRANTIEADGDDVILGRPNRFGLGFQLTIPGVRPLGPGAHSFGHYGNGAVLGFADPDSRIAFGYVCNRGGRTWRDPRNIALVDAVYSCL